MCTIHFYNRDNQVFRSLQAAWNFIMHARVNVRDDIRYIELESGRCVRAS